MRTEDDLRQVYTDLADHASDGHGLTVPQDGDRPVRHTTRTRVAVAAGAAAAAVIAVPVAVVALTHDGSESLTAPSSRWSYGFRLDLPDGWTSGSRTIETRFDTASAYGLQGEVCEIVVYRPGTFDTDRIPATRTAAHVNGRQGFVAEMQELRPDYPASLGEVFAPGLVWRYTDDAWASASCSSHTRGATPQRLLAGEFTVAKAVVAQPETLRLPYRIDRLPAGWSAARLYVQLGAYLGPIVRPDFRLQLRPATWSPPATPDPVAMEQPAGPNLSVTFGRSQNPMTRLPHATRMTINGRPAVLWHDTRTGGAAGIVITASGFEIRIETTKSTPGFDATLRAAAESIEFARDLTNKSTWFDAGVAIP